MGRGAPGRRSLVPRLPAGRSHAGTGAGLDRPRGRRRRPWSPSTRGGAGRTDRRTHMSLRTARIWAPLRLREFRLLWIGMTVSLLGDGIFTVALAWQVYELSDAPTALSVVGIAMSVPHIVLLLFGGVASDRFERRRVMIGADLVRGLAVAAFGVLSISGNLELWHIIVIAAAFGAGTAFFGPAFDAVVPDLVPEDLLTQANSLEQFIRPAAWRMLGPAVGGWLIAVWGPGVSFLIDAGTFAASVLFLALMRPIPLPTDAEDEGSVLHQIKGGFRYVRSQTWLWGTFLAATFAYLVFLGPTEVLLPFVVKNEMKGSASDLGLIFALGGVGAMVTAVLMATRPMPARNMTFIFLAWTASTLAGDGGLLRLQRARERWADRVDDHQAAPGPDPPAGSGLQLRRVHLRRPHAGLLRPGRTRRRRPRCPHDADLGRRRGQRHHLRVPLPAGSQGRRAGRGEPASTPPPSGPALGGRRPGDDRPKVIERRRPGTSSSCRPMGIDRSAQPCRFA